MDTYVIKMIGSDCWNLITYYKDIMEEYDRRMKCINKITNLDYTLKNGILQITDIFSASKDTSRFARELRRLISECALMHFGVSCCHERWKEYCTYNEGFRIVCYYDGTCRLIRYRIPVQYLHLYYKRHFESYINAVSDNFRSTISHLNNFIEASFLITDKLRYLSDFEEAYTQGSINEFQRSKHMYMEVEESENDLWLRQQYHPDVYSDAD